MLKHVSHRRAMLHVLGPVMLGLLVGALLVPSAPATPQSHQPCRWSPPEELVLSASERMHLLATAPFLSAPTTEMLRDDHGGIGIMLQEGQTPSLLQFCLMTWKRAMSFSASGGVSGQEGKLPVVSDDLVYVLILSGPFVLISRLSPMARYRLAVVSTLYEGLDAQSGRFLFWKVGPDVRQLSPSGAPGP